jgi:hypothetical protein
MPLRALRAVPDAGMTPTEPTSPDFAAARRRWEQAAAERRALKTKFDGAQAALQLALSPPGKGDHPSPRLIALADGYLAGRRSASADALRAEVIALDDQLTRAATVYSIERVAWEAAVEGEARRLATELKPEHRAAVHKIFRPRSRRNARSGRSLPSLAGATPWSTLARNSAP